MSTTAEKTNVLETAKSTAHNVFLANLGFYGKVYEQGQDLYKQTGEKLKQTEEKYKELLGKRSEIFEDLIKRGEVVQKDAVETFEKVKTEQKSALDERLEAMRGSFEKLKEVVTFSKEEEAPAKPAPKAKKATKAKAKASTAAATA